MYNFLFMQASYLNLPDTTFKVLLNIQNLLTGSFRMVVFLDNFSYHASAKYDHLDLGLEQFVFYLPVNSGIDYKKC